MLHVLELREKEKGEWSRSMCEITIAEQPESPSNRAIAILLEYWNTGSY